MNADPQLKYLSELHQGKHAHMEVRSYIPHLSLQAFVLQLATVKVVLPEGEVTTPYPPTPFQSLMFYCNDPVSMSREYRGEFRQQPVSVVLGPQVSRVNIRVHGRLNAIRVDFLPGGLHRLLGIPMWELLDEGLDAADVFGAGMRDLNEQLRNTADLGQGKVLVEAFLLKQLSGMKDRLPLDAALEVLLKHNGQLPINTTASLACLSLKQFERKCRERLGMNPKFYARILRFSKAYRLREAFPGRGWASIACEAGYYDQMHMIRDFRAFAGENPGIVEQQLSVTPIRMQSDLPG